jgi:hypothetical protein
MEHMKGTQEMKTLQTDLKIVHTNKEERKTQYESGTTTFRGKSITIGRDNNVDSRGPHGQSCTDEEKGKGTRREVPQFGKRCKGSAHNLSGSGRATC